MKKSKGIREWFYNLINHTKSCDHRFEIKEVMNIKIDPKCLYCGKPLSECNL